ncbi:MAG TPA: hypothetical protein VMW81_03165 [Nitrospinota bacterium]|nr:hypothetical protein [Nitrospinota bacterium]
MKYTKLQKEQKRRIEKIIARMECPKDFICYKSGFENLCEARDVGLESFLECLEKNPWECTFSISFGTAYYCRCPLRFYIIKELKV